MKSISYLKGIWLRGLNVLFPVTCAMCGADLPYDDKYRLCAKCLQKVQEPSGLRCAKCGTALPDGGEHCRSCLKRKGYHFESIWPACDYRDSARELVLKLKYGGREYLARTAALIMCSVIQPLRETGADCLVPVPMHWTKAYLRGYNQAELIAREISAITGIPTFNALRRHRFSPAQHALKRNDRLRNVAGTVRAEETMLPAIKGSRVFLVDDVCTTCATLEECAAVLRRKGAAEVYGAVFARD